MRPGVSGGFKAGRTANTAAVLHETHLHPILDLPAKQDPQCLHAHLEAGIMPVQTIYTKKKRISVPILHRRQCMNRPSLVTDLPSTPIAYGLPPTARASSWARVLPEPADVAHLERDCRDGTRAEPRGAVQDERRVAQGDLALLVPEVLLHDLLLQALKRGRNELLQILHERGPGGVLVAAAPRTLDEAEHLRVEPEVLVQAPCRRRGWVVERRRRARGGCCA